MKMNVKKMVLTAMLAAVAYLLVCFIRIPVVLFLSYEPKDVIITVGGFLLGPMTAFLCSAVVSLVEMVTISTTGPIGCVMNLLSTCSFACVAAVIYKKRHNLMGAVLGLVAGSVVMTAAMLLWNWLITPWYMGQPREAVEALLIPAFLPFNLLKAGFNTALTLMLYKPLVSALRRTGLVSSSTPKQKSKIGIYLIGAVLLITCILLLLVLQGKL
ncbi:MAG: ECF transporter S component [Oscillospiraceae bacterium]|nr:ECF transporter S component [Oscillospiraceae bacterium]